MNAKSDSSVADIDRQQAEWEKQNAFVITGQDDRAAIPVDCRSDLGIAIGLIDTILTAANVLKGMDLRHPEVVEALKDLRSSPELRRLLIGAVGFDYDTVKRLYEINTLEKVMQVKPHATNPDREQGDGAKTTPESE